MHCSYSTGACRVTLHYTSGQLDGCIFVKYINKVTLDEFLYIARQVSVSTCVGSVTAMIVEICTKGIMSFALRLALFSIHTDGK